MARAETGDSQCITSELVAVVVVDSSMMQVVSRIRRIVGGFCAGRLIAHKPGALGLM